MKKFSLFASAMFICIAMSAQLTVNSNGNVSIQSTETPLSAISVGGAGAVRAKIAVISNINGLNVYRTGTPSISYGWWNAAECTTDALAGKFNIGVRGSARSSSVLSTGRAYGIWGEAGNTTSGYNYGVYGVLQGMQNGAAIFGTLDATSGGSVAGRYAGYFEGDIRVTGNIYGTIISPAASTASSVSLTRTRSITNDEIANESVIDKLSQLSAVQYNFNLPTAMATASRTALTDTLSTTANLSVTDVQALEKTHFGLVAQDLQQIYPDLVYENQQGELCINYIEMIPLLVQSISELKNEITLLQGNNINIAKTRNITDIEEESLLIPMLEQNNPNPFSENTVIAYTLPQNVQTAIIYIYNMNGTQVNQLTLTERGNASITLNAGQLAAGMYLYSLVADGKVISTKRMILTK